MLALDRAARTTATRSPTTWPRAAAWAQHGGLYWIPNAPTDRIERVPAVRGAADPLPARRRPAEGALVALPQYLAELAILVAVYGVGTTARLRRARSAACAAFLLATFSLFALEATTAQNDLVAASFPVSRRVPASSGQAR